MRLNQEKKFPPQADPPLAEKSRRQNIKLSIKFVYTLFPRRAIFVRLFVFIFTPLEICKRFFSRFFRFNKVKKASLHFLKFAFLMGLIFTWIFSGWPQIWQNPPIPPEVEEARAEVKPLQTGDKRIDFNYTDDNSGENLIIKTDEKTYIGLTRAEVYFSITNTGDESEAVNFQFHFPEDRGEVKKIERWQKDIPYEVDIPDYGPKTFICKEGWKEIIEEGFGIEKPLIFYHCSSTDETTFCSSLSEENKNCILDKAQTGSHKETRYKDNWQETELSNKSLEIKQEFFDKLSGKGIKRKPIPQNFRAKKSTDLKRYLIEPNQTQYFKMEINFPVDSSGEFYIEVIGDKSGYGLLDPWWDSSWSYKKQISLAAGSGAGTDYQIKLLVGESSGSTGYNFHLEGHGKSDFGDLRFTNSAENTELSYWIESVSGATPNQTATVWVKVTDSLDSNVSIYAYYGNASATYNNSTGGNNTFIFFDDFSGDLSKWTKHKELGTITLTGGYVECGGGVTSSPYGHTVLGSSATYTGFQDGIIEFKHYHAANGIGEVSYRGNYANNTGYKGRWDARSGSESVFLKPPYSGWANIDDAMAKWITAGIWYKGKLVMHGNIMDLYDNDSFKNTLTHTEYTSAGEISLQNHYGSYTRFDDVRVRKYASTEPAFSSAGSEETPGLSTAIEIRAQNYTTSVSSITFPEAASETTVSQPYNNIDGSGSPQTFGGAGVAKPLVTLYNSGASTLTIWYNITTFTNSVVSSEYYLINAKGAACANADAINNAVTFGADTSTGTTIAAGAGNEKDLYLKVVLSAVAGKTGTSTLTILGEAL